MSKGSGWTQMGDDPSTAERSKVRNAGLLASGRGLTRRDVVAEVRCYANSRRGHLLARVIQAGDGDRDLQTEEFRVPLAANGTANLRCPCDNLHSVPTAELRRLINLAGGRRSQLSIDVAAVRTSGA